MDTLLPLVIGIEETLEVMIQDSTRARGLEVLKEAKDLRGYGVSTDIGR